ncbi:hypothetical protein [uncultured Methanobrevibacter sp.]|uniref:hypothetical protein n=1 Tax=uncultured Methanobrevibacter sp. TaxID=253161 RepID=UPI002633C10C
MFAIEGLTLIPIIQSILLIISALIIIIAVVGVLKIDADLPNVVYGRIHILGMVDIAGIIAFIALEQYLFALIYLLLAPLLAHAMANAYYHKEDMYNNPVLNPEIESDALDGELDNQKEEDGVAGISADEETVSANADVAGEDDFVSANAEDKEESDSKSLNEKESDSKNDGV